MLTIGVSGYSGFVGKNLCHFLSQEGYTIKKVNTRNIISNDTLNDCDIFIHLAGIAHDLNSKYNYDDYYKVNFELTKKLYDLYLRSSCRNFIFFSSIKSIADKSNFPLTENVPANPKSDYGRTKLLAEEYIQNYKCTGLKKYFILRPSMIHGYHNKGHLNLLYKFVKMGLPWPFGVYKNQRSFCSIDNLCFILKKIIENDNINSGVYHICDSGTLSTNELITIINESLNKKSNILQVPKLLINFIASIGTILHLPLNNDKLKKISESLIIDNSKILKEINQKLPIDIKLGLKKTIKSF